MAPRPEVGRLLYRVSEAAEVLSISRAKVYELMADGEIGSVKIAASRRIPADELQAYVDRLRAESGISRPNEGAAPKRVA